MDGIGYDYNEIVNRVQKLFNYVVKDLTKDITSTNEDILKHVEWYE